MVEKGEGERRIRDLLGRRIRVTMSDGRIMEGAFECVDVSLNIVVRDLRLGLVMVPGEHVAKCEVLEGSEEGLGSSSADAKFSELAEASFAEAQKQNLKEA